MDLSRHVATARDGNKSIIATITDYYDRFVHPYGDEYTKSSFKSSRLVLCPFHGDINPSLGLIRDKRDKDLEVFNCFGCGASGTIVNFHRRFVFISEKRNLTMEDASREIARIYGIEINEDELQDYLGNLLGEKEVAIQRTLTDYNYRAHCSNMLKLRQAFDSMPINKVATNLDVVLNKWKLSLVDKGEDL